ncbi:MAG: hypothetical protein KDE51_06500 [Anaerolineales bacterium]|nr:hypothetical protein [Anaerolineales bacterium]
MKRQQLKMTLSLLGLLFLLTLGAAVVAQTSAGFNLEWHVLGGGGGVSSSADYQVNGTIGQSLTSPPVSDSATYAISSGYWVMNRYTSISLPVILNK